MSTYKGKGIKHYSCHPKGTNTYHTDIINLLQYTIAFTPDSDSECEVQGTGKTPFLLLYIYVLIIII